MSYGLVRSRAVMFALLLGGPLACEIGSARQQAAYSGAPASRPGQFSPQPPQSPPPPLGQPPLGQPVPLGQLLAPLGQVLAPLGQLLPGQPQPPSSGLPSEPWPSTGPPFPGAPPQPSYAPGGRVQWQQVPPTNAAVDARWGPTLTDVMQHKSERDRQQWPDLATTAHELTHGIHFELRLVHSQDRPRNGFYVLGGRAAVVTEPGFRKSQVAALVPHSLRASRYENYLAGMPGWDARPLYVWDEWTAYIIGGKVAVERYRLGLEPHTTSSTSDRVFAILEFTVYAMATVLAARMHAPQYLQSELQFLEFFAYNAERAMAVFNEGRFLPPFQWSAITAYEASLRTDPEAEPLRQTLRSTYGASWTQRVFGF